VAIALEEFLLPGHWTVVTTPSDAVAEPEDRARGIEIILRRAEPTPAPAAPTLSPAADSVVPPGADTAPAPSADTLYRIAPVAPPPSVDTDSDRVPDDRDVCLATPSGGIVDASGCAPLFTPAAPVLTLRDVQFETGKAVMLASSMPALDSIARQLVALPDEAIEVGGHTDSSGIYRRNVALARARAETVRHYLHTRGVPLERMTARGFGPNRPVASNRTPEGRSLNRRVELRRRSAAAPRSGASGKSAAAHSTLSTSTSNTSVAPGGMAGGAPPSP
jgi:outer membrane protein OmpA-like peptidoglycan-associated protein